MNFYRFYRLIESQLEDLVHSDPEIKKAVDRGVDNIQYLKWMLKTKGQEPVEDIIPLLTFFDQNKQRLIKKDIFSYQTPSELRAAIENLGTSKSEKTRKLKKEETTNLGEIGGWTIVMPHTTESSCHHGKDTTWCTAATQSENLFLKYVARKDSNITLFYLTKRGIDPRVDPFAKIAIGFKEGEPILDQGYGGLSVNSQNAGLTIEKLKELFGNNYNQIMNVLKNHSNRIGDKHPAKEQIQLIANSKDPSLFDKYTKNMNEESRVEFVKLLKEYGLSSEMIKRLIHDENGDIRMEIAYRYPVPPEITEIYKKEQLAINNPLSPTEVFEKFSRDKSWRVRTDVASTINPKINKDPRLLEVLIRLTKDPNDHVKFAAFENPNLPTEVLSKAVRDEEENLLVLSGVAQNKKTSGEDLAKLYEKIKNNNLPMTHGIKMSIALHKNTLPETLRKLSQEQDGYIKKAVASNPNTPTLTIVGLSITDSKQLKEIIIKAAASNPNNDPRMLQTLAQSRDIGIRTAVYNNPSTPSETKEELKDKIRK